MSSPYSVHPCADCGQPHWAEPDAQEPLCWRCERVREVQKMRLP